MPRACRPDQQLTTAHDLALLGRAIHDRYPRYFHYFSIPSFHYAGQTMPNHNHLMEQVEGMDGIKTGYTRDSGFNLLASVNRNGHWLIAVVLGGRSRLGRDRIMADMIAAEIDKCATHRTAPMVAENPALEQVAEAIPVIEHEGDAAPPVEAVDEEAAESPAPNLQAAAIASTEPEGTTGGAGGAQDGGKQGRRGARDAARTPGAAGRRLDRASAWPALATPQPRPRPAFVPGLPKGERDMTATGSIPPHRDRADGSTSRYIGASTATPSALRHSATARRDRVETKVAAIEPQPTGRPAGRGVVIQIGATPTMIEANGLLARAKGQSRGALAGAKPFTEKVQKGREDPVPRPLRRAGARRRRCRLPQPEACRRLLLHLQKLVVTSSRPRSRSFQPCRRSSTSLASLARAASSAVPPWSGCHRFMSVRCARTTASRGAPRPRPSTS